ncbi:Abi-alpha family protein [Hymenobacter cheonanensis]|uniref:Abi-alpha family protein n=1 Tax=Hymenobacter sp. CA2-7 TaxID=3063993 RepID=UPI0027140068|nr:Abi-alpha family protein [Hymenobacter sp. CA2-7]MDO7884296.1 Abi-alpha family protein [Hymenobacter sp. CA2-7]
MPEPISTVVTAITEHPQVAAAVASIYGVAKPFLTKVLGLAAEEIGEIGRDYIKGQRTKNAERTLTDADKLLAVVRREAQRVPFNIAVPLLEGASLQEEPTLADKWAALLANAADPAQRVAVQPSFADVLRQLTPTDAQVLEFIYAEHPPQEGDLFCHYPTVEDALGNFDWQAIITETSLGNLSRLRLFDFASGSLYNADNTLNVKQRFLFSAYGGQFMLAVTPPTP